MTHPFQDIERALQAVSKHAVQALAVVAQDLERIQRQVQPNLAHLVHQFTLRLPLSPRQQRRRRRIVQALDRVYHQERSR